MFSQECAREDLITIEVDWLHKVGLGHPVVWLLEKKRGGRKEKSQEGIPIFGPGTKSEEGRAAKARPEYPHFWHPLTAAEET